MREYRPVPLKKIDDAAHYAAEIAARVAQILWETRAELQTSDDSRKEFSASYAMALAAAGFLTEEVKCRKKAAAQYREIADAIEQDLIEGYFF